ncbi:MAG: hypothetical protein LBR77_08615 [Lachnospiraceae bacterium]|nr:hypothetical protein [Lachnospiraceae bacterium]
MRKTATMQKMRLTAEARKMPREELEEFYVRFHNCDKVTQELAVSERIRATYGLVHMMAFGMYCELSRKNQMVILDEMQHMLDDKVERGRKNAAALKKVSGLDRLAGVERETKTIRAKSDPAAKTAPLKVAQGK